MRDAFRNKEKAAMYVYLYAKGVLSPGAMAGIALIFIIVFAFVYVNQRRKFRDKKDDGAEEEE